MFAVKKQQSNCVQILALDRIIVNGPSYGAMLLHVTNTPSQNKIEHLSFGASSCQHIIREADFFRELE